MQGWEPETAPPSLLPSRTGLAPVAPSTKTQCPLLPGLSVCPASDLRQQPSSSGELEVIPLPPAFSAGPRPRYQLWNPQGPSVFAERGSVASPGRAWVQACHCSPREHPMGVISPSPSSAPCDSAEQVKSHFQRHLLLPQPGLESHLLAWGVTEDVAASWGAPTGNTAQPPAQCRAEERLHQGPGSPPPDPAEAISFQQERHAPGPFSYDSEV